MTNRNNALHDAVQAGNLVWVERQIGMFDINEKGPWGETALLKAVKAGHTHIVKLLLTRNPDVNSRADGGVTALMYAAHWGHTEIVKVLLNTPVSPYINVNQPDNMGNSAMMIAAKLGRTEIVKELLKSKTYQRVNVNNTNNAGETAIDVAKTEEIRNLLRGGVPPPTPVVPSPTPIITPASRVRPYVGPAIMSFRATSRSVLASGRSLAAHIAGAPSEERQVQELALILDGLCKRGEFRDLSAVTRVLSKPTGQSVVFEGVYQGQQVAVKVFLDRTTKDTAANEVAYLRKCAHRHVLRTLIMYEYNTRAMLVMPMADGDLNGVIDKAEGPLPIAQVTGYVKQLATALVFLHDEKRVAHLDLKPGNVFLAKSDKRVLLADFGMAMDITDITRDQLLDCGTPCFQAPELWAQRLGEPVQRGNRAKVDVYAFGCMVWQLLTRQCPFQREIENDGWGNDKFLLLATAVRRDRRSPAGMMEARWPEPLRRVIQACCAYEPERRPTMAELLSKAEYLG